jgi:hypothetical protein
MSPLFFSVLIFSQASGAADSPAMHTRQKVELPAGPVPGTVTKGRAGTPLRALFNNLVDSPAVGSPSTPKLDEISGSLAAHSIAVPAPAAGAAPAMKAVRSVRVEAVDDKATKKVRCACGSWQRANALTCIQSLE